MSVMDDVFAHFLGKTPEEAQRLLDSFRNAGSAAVDQGLSAIPGMSSVKDIVTNAPAIMPPAMAAGATGAPLAPNLPNPGNPVSGMAQGAVASALSPEASQEPRGASRSWEPATPPPAPETPPVAPPASPAAPSAAPSEPAQPAPAAQDPLAAILGKDPTEDKRLRDANMAELELNRRKNLLPAAVAGFGDAVAAGANTRGAGLSTDAMKGVLASGDKALETGKTDFEQKLRNDPNSDVSKQYQALLAEMTKKSIDDPMLLGLSANQIAEKIPAIEKMMERRSKEEMERLKLRQERELAAAKAAKEPKPTTAQTAVDKQFAKTYEDFVVQGGYGKALSQLSTLEGIVTDLQGGKKNLSGAGFKMVPDIAERVVFPDKVASQQAAEQAIQEGLRATLGAQFTEREGQLFMQRGYDPNLDEKKNAEKLIRTVNQLKLMIIAKKRAADYYEENGTLNGYKGDLFTIKDGAMVKATPEDFAKMLEPTPMKRSESASPAASTGSRKTKSGISYSVEP